MKLRVLSLAIAMAYLSPALAQAPAPQAPAKPDEAERLVPAVSAFIDKVDRAGRTITVDWGEDY